MHSLTASDSNYDRWRNLRRVDPDALAALQAQVLDKDSLTDDDVSLLRFSIVDAAKSDNIDKAIETGRYLLTLKSHGNLEAKEDYVGLRHPYSYCQQLMQVASETERMSQLVGPKRPNAFRTCYFLIAFDSRTGLYNIPPTLFAEIIAKEWFGTATTKETIQDWIHRYKRKEFDIATGTVPEQYLDTVTGGDCFELTAQLPDNSLDAVITSPPYGTQRKDHYPSVPTDRYHLWFAEYMRILKPKLKDTGSVLVELAQSVRQGQQDHYIWRTLLKVCDEGWVNPLECVIVKNDPEVKGSNNVPRSKYHHLLWFCKSTHPDINMLACGKYSERLGKKHGRKRKPWNSADSEVLDKGPARVGNVIEIEEPDNIVIDITGCKTDKTKIDHSAKMVPALAESIGASLRYQPIPQRKRLQGGGVVRDCDSI